MAVVQEKQFETSPQPSSQPRLQLLQGLPPSSSPAIEEFLCMASPGSDSTAPEEPPIVTFSEETRDLYDFHGIKVRRQNSYGVLTFLKALEEIQTAKQSAPERPLNYVDRDDRLHDYLFLDKVLEVPLEESPDGKSRGLAYFYKNTENGNRVLQMPVLLHSIVRVSLAPPREGDQFKLFI